MDIQISLDLNDEEIDQLAGILKCEIEELPEVLGKHSAAAAEEYCRMFLGQKVFTRGSDFKEYRLFLLIQHAFQNEIPAEQDICDLFQVTLSQARTLNRSVLSKYQYDLSRAIETSLKKAIQKAEYSKDESAYLITVDNRNIIDSLNQLLGSIDGTLPPIEKRSNTISTYVLQKSSRARLAQELNLQLEE